MSAFPLPTSNGYPRTWWVKLMPSSPEYQKEMPDFSPLLVDKSVEKRGITLGNGGKLSSDLSLRR